MFSLIVFLIIGWILLVCLPVIILTKVFTNGKLTYLEMRIKSLENRIDYLQHEHDAQAHNATSTVPLASTEPQSQHYATPTVPLATSEPEEQHSPTRITYREPLKSFVESKASAQSISSDDNPFEYRIEPTADTEKVDIYEVDQVGYTDQPLDTPILVNKPTPIQPRTVKTPKSDKPNDFDRVELQIGRKIFAWGAVALFVVALALLAQTALARGWFTPLTRFSSILLFGVAALFAGRYTFKRGLRAYSRTLDSTGVIAFFLSGYYALSAELFAPALSATILCASVFLGYFLSTLRRSSLVAFVSSIGGLLAPVLIQSEFSLQWIAPYLIVYLLASIAVVNYLRRSYLALLPLYGVLALLWDISDAVSSAEFGLYTTTLIVLAALELIDQSLVLLFARRHANFFDVIRALSIPFITLGVFVLLCKHADYTVRLGALTDYPIALYNRYGFIPIGLFAALYGTLLLRWLKLEKSPLTAIKLSNASKPQWQVVDFAKRLQLRGYLASACFASLLASLAVIVTLVFSQRFTSVGLLALAVTLMIITQRVASQPVLPSQFDDVEDVKLHAALFTSFQKSQTVALYVLFLWSMVDSILGVSKLATYFTFNYEMYPVRLFLTDAGASQTPWPLLNVPCIPLLVSAIILLCAGFARRYKTPNASPTVNLSQVWAQLVVCLGAAVLLTIAVSETFAALAVRIYRANYAAPSAVAVCSVASLWALVALAIYLLALPRRRSAWRVGSYYVLLALLIKLGVFHLVNHANLEFGSLPPLFFTPGLHHTDIPEALRNFRPYDWTTPLWNLFSFPFLVAFVVALAVAIMEGTFYRRQLQTSDSKALVQRPSFAVTLGVLASLLFYLDSSLDLWRLVTYKYAPYYMNAWRTLWLYWTIGGVAVWAIGRLAQSSTTRNFAYFILTVALPFVCYGEFFTGNARTNGSYVPTILSVYALPAACYFIALIILGIRSKKLPTVVSNTGVTTRSPEAQALHFLGLTVGDFGILTLLTFEVIRYFAGRNFIGATIHPRLFGMTILWSAAIIVISLLYRKTRPTSLIFIMATLFVACLVKYFGWDLPSLRRHAGLPFLSLFAFNTYFIFLCLLRLATSLTRGANGERSEKLRPLFGILLTIALLQLLVGTTADLYCRLEKIPIGVGADSFFLAQTAVSVLWALFAGVLMAFGFLKRSRLLRWHAIILFCLTTIKILTHDLSYLDSAYRFIGFFILAVALTVAAYAYNRLSHK